MRFPLYSSCSCFRSKGTLYNLVDLPFLIILNQKISFKPLLFARDWRKQWHVTGHWPCRFSFSFHFLLPFRLPLLTSCEMVSSLSLSLSVTCYHHFWVVFDYLQCSSSNSYTSKLFFIITSHAPLAKQYTKKIPPSIEYFSPIASFLVFILLKYTSPMGLRWYYFWKKKTMCSTDFHRVIKNKDLVWVRCDSPKAIFCIQPPLLPGIIFPICFVVGSYTSAMILPQYIRGSKIF